MLATILVKYIILIFKIRNNTEINPKINLSTGLVYMYYIHNDRCVLNLI